MNDASLDQDQLDTFELRVADRYFPHSATREVKPADELDIDFRALLNRLVDLFRGFSELGDRFDNVTSTLPSSSRRH